MDTDTQVLLPKKDSDTTSRWRCHGCLLVYIYLYIRYMYTGIRLVGDDCSLGRTQKNTKLPVDGGIHVLHVVEDNHGALPAQLQVYAARTRSRSSRHHFLKIQYTSDNVSGPPEPGQRVCAVYIRTPYRVYGVWERDMDQELARLAESRLRTVDGLAVGVGCQRLE